MVDIACETLSADKVSEHCSANIDPTMPPSILCFDSELEDEGLQAAVRQRQQCSNFWHEFRLKTLSADKVSRRGVLYCLTALYASAFRAPDPLK
ncbi:hypothetical protein QM996_31290 (plasmid) [Sinorhizobium chiapasense]|uniref:hypothetical protein n=1 Tax=Sinorhizobium chiapasense TaxID=501572 RepID=UPI002FE15735